MISGIGSLNLSVVMEFAVPLIVVCAAGFLINWFWFIIVGGKSSDEDWFERNMMVWGSRHRRGRHPACCCSAWLTRN